LNYDRFFGGKHHVYGLYLYNRDSKWARIDPNGPSAALLQQYNYIPVNFSGQSIRVGYDFKDKYLLQLNVGYNGTDRFGDGSRFGTFPAASVGYNIAEESFFKNVGVFNFINVFKLRASYGIVGSDQLPSGSFYSYRNDYVANGQTNRNVQGNFGNSTGTSGNVTTSIQEGTLSNENVTWEKEKQLDIGLDFSLFKKRLSGSVDIFNRNRYDILTTRGTVSTIFGANLPPVNLGRVNNKGYELELTYGDKIGKDFTYSVRGTYAVAINKVLFRDEPTFQYAYQQATGRPVGDPLLYKWTGHFYSDAADIAKRPAVDGSLGIARPGGLEYADINGDGLINTNDRGFFAKPNLANTNYGFSFDFHYKGLGLSALFQGIMNGSSSVVGQSSQAFISNLTELHTQAWTPALGDAARYPWLSTSITNNSLDDPARASSTFWTRSTDYLRLRTMQISYQLPSAWLDKVRIKDMRLYVNGNNLLTWSDFEKTFRVDPEVSPGSVNIPYPTQKAVNIGLNVTF
jgi:TonB-linked SusC/RagA family outer membrane protein